MCAGTLRPTYPSRLSLTSNAPHGVVCDSARIPLQPQLHVRTRRRRRWRNLVLVLVAIVLALGCVALVVAITVTFAISRGSLRTAVVDEPTQIAVLEKQDAPGAMRKAERTA